MTPTISVCVPTRNRAASLSQTLEAILLQTSQDFEIVVGDDASTDETSEVMHGYRDPRIRYHRHAVNLGIYDNWNSLIGLARGRFVCIYHDHDTYLPTILERSLALLERHSDMAFVHTGIVLVDTRGTPLDVFAGQFPEVTPGRELRELLSRTTRNTLCAASTMVRREVYAAAGPFDTRFGLAADRWMWFRLAAIGSVGYVSDPQALILGRSQGDPTERFTLGDLLGNYRISAEALRELWPPESVEHWAADTKLRREVRRDLVVAVLKSIVFGTPAEIEERIAMVTTAVSSWEARILRAATRPPMRSLLKALARRSYERRLALRQRQAIDFVRGSTVLRDYLPKGVQ